MCSSRSASKRQSHLPNRTTEQVAQPLSIQKAHMLHVMVSAWCLFCVASVFSLPPPPPISVATTFVCPQRSTLFRLSPPTSTSATPIPKSRPVSNKRQSRRRAWQNQPSSPMSDPIYPNPLVIPSKAKQSATAIVLHGLGDTGNGWSFVGEDQIWAGALPYLKFIVPTAPTMPVTMYGGSPSTAWFNLNSLDIDERVEERSTVDATFNFVTEIVEKEIANGTNPGRIVIVGYSQGAAMALTMLRSEHKFAGVIGMSGWLPLFPNTPIISAVNKDTPVFLCHGTYDPTVAFINGKKAFDILSQDMKNIEFKGYSMAHSVCMEELEDTRKFLEKILPPI